MRRGFPRLLLPVIAGILLLALLAPAAGASDQWCEDDPPVWLTTPQGNRLLVFVTLAAPSREFRGELRRAEITYTAVARTTPDGQPSTAFEIRVLVPDNADSGRFPTRGHVSSRPFKRGVLYSYSEGASGTAMQLPFVVSLP